MASTSDYKTLPDCHIHSGYADLIAFTCPHLVSPTFSIEAEMAASRLEVEGNLHVVPMPACFKYVGAIKFLSSFIIMVLTASVAGIWGNFMGFALTLFVSVATLVIGGYYRLALGYKPVLYNRWAVLGLETFGVSFWIASFTLLVEWDKIYNNPEYWGKAYLAYLPYNETHADDSTLLLRTSAGQYHAGVMLAIIATSLSGLEAVLFSATLVIFSANLRRHRQLGYPAVYGRSQIDSVMTTPEGHQELEKVRS